MFAFYDDEENLLRSTKWCCAYCGGHTATQVEKIQKQLQFALIAFVILHNASLVERFSIYLNLSFVFKARVIRTRFFFAITIN